MERPTQQEEIEEIRKGVRRTNEHMAIIDTNRAVSLGIRDRIADIILHHQSLSREERAASELPQQNGIKDG